MIPSPLDVQRRQIQPALVVVRLKQVVPDIVHKVPVKLLAVLVHYAKGQLNEEGCGREVSC